MIQTHMIKIELIFFLLNISLSKCPVSYFVNW